VLGGGVECLISERMAARVGGGYQVRLLWSCDAGRCRPMESSRAAFFKPHMPPPGFRNWLRCGEACNGSQMPSGVAGMYAARRWGALGRICIDYDHQCTLMPARYRSSWAQLQRAHMHSQRLQDPVVER
jgi:hypothetical protein